MSATALGLGLVFKPQPDQQPVPGEPPTTPTEHSYRAGIRTRRSNDQIARGVEVLLLDRQMEHHLSATVRTRTDPLDAMG